MTAAPEASFLRKLFKAVFREFKDKDGEIRPMRNPRRSRNSRLDSPGEFPDDRACVRPRRSRAAELLRVSVHIDLERAGLDDRQDGRMLPRTWLGHNVCAKSCLHA
jgi:hypothetical protein